jgi:outer membrane protein TolC
MTVPDAFIATSGTAVTKTAGSTHSTLDIAKWWLALNDPELNLLVERAIQANPSLEIALTRLQEARTSEGAITGGGTA